MSDDRKYKGEKRKNNKGKKPQSDTPSGETSANYNPPSMKRTRRKKKFEGDQDKNKSGYQDKNKRGRSSGDSNKQEDEQDKTRGQELKEAGKRKGSEEEKI